MDNLRLTLKVLFREIDGDKILSVLRMPDPVRGGTTWVDRETFIRIFRELDDGYSLEQATSVFRMVETGWMQQLDNTGLRYAEGTSVFNVLLAFGREALSFRDPEPVCRYEYLMRWVDLAANLGEDVLTTAFLASRDLSEFQMRNSFAWKPIIDHDNQSLNDLFESRKFADLHFHLRGSSQIFMLNWLSLMNRISGWQSQFDKLGHYQSPQLRFTDEQHEVPLYLCTIKACAIRYLLTVRACGIEHELSLDDDEWLVLQMLQCDTVVSAYGFVPELERRIRSFGYCCGKCYGDAIVDYAIPRNLNMADSAEEMRHRLTLLSGERRMMYMTFRNIYSGHYRNTMYPTLFYAYLLFKNRLRTELVQLNGKAGFANFQHYQNRKGLFIRPGSVYEILIPHLAVSLFFLGGPGRYLEARIAPENTSARLADTLEQYDWAIADRRFSTGDTKAQMAQVVSETGRSESQKVRKYPLAERNECFGGSCRRRCDWNYNYIVHFIKREDRNLTQESALSLLVPRHYELRNLIRRQAFAIAKLWRSSDARAERISGIDAASAEAACRPEVFGQAFRYLRDCRPDPRLEYLLQWKRVSLGVTYHVGEDFLDVVDGLRAVDEACLFLNLQRHDRLGHALVLGIAVEPFYARTHNKVVMPKQLFLDNIVWLYHKACQFGLARVYELKHWIEQQFAQLYDDIYGPCLKPETPISFFDYYLSWLLRGDDPEKYSLPDAGAPRNADTECTLWAHYALCQIPERQRELEQARRKTSVRLLYSRYHFDPDVKRQGVVSGEFEVSDAFIRLVAEVQRKMVDELMRIGIYIETNPTSNLRIHKMLRYEHHPLLRLYNHGLDLPYPKCSVPLSINTDDLGVFDTSLEREYSLMAWAVEKLAQTQEEALRNAPRDVYLWLEEIRKMTFEQTFMDHRKR